MLINLFFVILLCFSFSNTNKFDSELDKAISDLYNFKLDSCIHKLSKLSEQNTKDPLIPFLEIAAKWQQILLHENHNLSYKVIFDGIDSAVPFYLEMIDKYPNDPSKYSDPVQNIENTAPLGEGTLDMALPFIVLIGTLYFIFKFFRK